MSVAFVARLSAAWEGFSSLQAFYVEPLHKVLWVSAETSVHLGLSREVLPKARSPFVTNALHKKTDDFHIGSSSQCPNTPAHLADPSLPGSVGQGVGVHDSSCLEPSTKCNTMQALIPLPYTPRKPLILT